MKYLSYKQFREGSEDSGNYGHAGRPGQVGGSASNNIKEIENTTFTDKLLKEQGMIIKKDGTILHPNIKGNKYAVEIPEKMLADLKDNIFTHNHLEETPLSYGDFGLFMQYNILEMRAVTPTATYIFKRPDPAFTDEEKYEISHLYNDLIQEYIHTQNKGREPKKADPYRKMMEPIYKELSEKTRFSYKKEPR